VLSIFLLAFPIQNKKKNNYFGDQII